MNMAGSGRQVILRCDGLTVRRGERTVLHAVSFDLHAGELIALLGPNGAGKSTLLDALGGALPAAEGEVQRHGRIAVALQGPDLARRSALANVVLALAWWGVPRGERDTRAREALRAMRADHLASRPAGRLSGGERRRVHVARALAVRPDILMLDEPFAGLDAETRAELLADTGSALRAVAAAALVVVHDRAEAWALADRLLVMLDGRIVADGPPRALLEQPPSPEVARFLGFDGALEEDAGVLLTRPQHVVVDADAPLRAVVEGVIPLEDGVRLALRLERGRLYALAPLPGPRAGETVGVRVVGGVRFAGDAGAGMIGEAWRESRSTATS
jgi:ABC-type sulfate/molybdate transport systems ATPase subunit